MGPTLRLIVGLGNDDSAYRNTPHNIGFAAVGRLAEKMDTRPRDHKDFILYESGGNVALATAHSYMNVCGSAIAKAMKAAGAGPGELLVIVDDFALPWGKLRLRKNGSAGGHNGLKSLIETLGTQDFPRLRVGIGPVPAGVDPSDYVLRRQSAARINDLAQEAARAALVAAQEGLEAAMNQFNVSSQ